MSSVLGHNASRAARISNMTSSSVDVILTSGGFFVGFIGLLLLLGFWSSAGPIPIWIWILSVLPITIATFTEYCYRQHNRYKIDSDRKHSKTGKT